MLVYLLDSVLLAAKCICSCVCFRLRLFSAGKVKFIGCWRLMSQINRYADLLLLGVEGLTSCRGLRFCVSSLKDTNLAQCKMEFSQNRSFCSLF